MTVSIPDSSAETDSAGLRGRPRALIGAGRQAPAGLLIVCGALLMVAAIALPWGTNGGAVVSGLSADLSTYSAAIVILAIASVVLAVMAFRGDAVSVLGRSLGVVATLFCGFLCLLLPAGIDVASKFQEEAPTVSSGMVGFGVGTWLIAVGVVAIALGTMLCCPRSRRMRLALLVIPALFAVLFAVELQ